MRLARVSVCTFIAFVFWGGEGRWTQAAYKVWPGITHNNLTVFPVTADKVFDTMQFITLDQGIRSGQVIVSELGETRGLIRPRSMDPGIWPEYPIPPRPVRPIFPRPRVNTLALTNNSDHPLIVLAGEIVTGGKQDRVVGKDRIIPPHSDPVSLEVFCVEPHRWTGASLNFQGTAYSMVQPSVRLHAMAAQNQEQVWNEVARSRAAFAGMLTVPQALAMQSSSSYADAVQNNDVRQLLDSITIPIEHSYGKLREQLRSQKAVGAVVAINGEIIWADVFASPDLLDRFWPKLISSYAAESLGSRIRPTGYDEPATQANAQKFLDQVFGGHQSVETEPDLYSTTEIQGDHFKVFVLTSLLPKTGFPIHIAKMEQLHPAAD